MRLLKKLFYVLATCICLNGCAFFAVKPSSSSSSSSSSHDYTKEERITELNRFLNSSHLDMTLYVILPEYDQEMPYLNFYAEEDLFLQENCKDLSVKQIVTPSKEYVSGDGFAAWREKDNSAYFDNGYVDYNDYFSSVSISSNGAALEFKLNYYNFSTDHDVLGLKALYDAASGYGVNLNDLIFVATFTDNKVTALSIAFRRYVENIGLTTIIVAYVVNGYGNAVEKRIIDFNEFYEVDDRGMDFIKHDIECRMNGESPAVLLTYDVIFDPVNKQTVPEDEIIAELTIHDSAAYKDHSYLIRFSDVVYDETTNWCTLTLGGKVFEFYLLAHEKLPK